MAAKGQCLFVEYNIGNGLLEEGSANDPSQGCVSCEEDPSAVTDEVNSKLLQLLK